MTPRHSIVMPTRNRCGLLRYAMQSALDQPSTDLEILVSDNASHDDTPAVVRGFRDPRLRYVRTPETLAMPDSWEFALAHATGEYVTFLCDDDAMTPRLIDTVDRVISDHAVEVVCWRRQNYVHPSWYVPEQRNILQYTSSTGRVAVLESRVAIRALCDAMSVQQGALGPLMLNSVISRRVIEAVSKRMGRFFLRPSPDYSTYMAALTQVERYAFVDAVLMIAGTARESIGSSAAYRPDTETTANFMKEFKGEALIRLTPLRAFLVTNGIAESLLEVKRAMPEALDWVDLDWVNYFAACYAEMLQAQRNGSDMSAEFAEFRRVLAGQPTDVRRRVRSATRLLPLTVALGAVARHVIYRRDPVLAQLIAFVLWRVRRWLPSVPLRGETEGFTNILECARRLEAIVDRYERRRT